VQAVRSLAPAPPIELNALDWLRAHGLAGGARGCARGAPAAADNVSDAEAASLVAGRGFGRVGISWAPDTDGGAAFVGVHLRSFLARDGRTGDFSSSCAEHPGLLYELVRARLRGAPLGTKVVVATDKYDSPCYAALARELGEDPAAAAAAAAAAAGAEDAGAFMSAREGGAVIPLRGASRARADTCTAAVFEQEVLGHSAAFIGNKGSTFSIAIHHNRVLRCAESVDSTTFL
jgi:hypothetical protein